MWRNFLVTLLLRCDVYLCCYDTFHLGRDGTRKEKNCHAEFISASSISSSSQVLLGNSYFRLCRLVYTLPSETWEREKLGISCYVLILSLLPMSDINNCYDKHIIFDKIKKSIVSNSISIIALKIIF